MSQSKAACLQVPHGRKAHFLGMKLSGDVRGVLFEAQVEQYFVNPGASPMEVVYTFPLPWGTVLLGVDVLLGQKQLRGAVVGKAQAETQYEDALADGDAAILLEKNSDQSYSLNLGNLAALEHCTITLRYAQTLNIEQGTLRLMIPAVIAPRYGDAMHDAGLKAHQTVAHDIVLDYPLTLDIRLHGELAQARVASPSHPISVAHCPAEQGHGLLVSLAQHAWLDRDFVLLLDQLQHTSLGVVAADDMAAGSLAALLSFCPRIPAQTPVATTLKILVDCSGSMAGDSITAAKRALHSIVQHMKTGDRFALSRFGDTVEHRSRGLWKLSANTVIAAQRWISRLDADMGGTEMEEALISTFALSYQGESRGESQEESQRGSDVLLVTDGQIDAITHTIESAKTSRHRLFVVGIGSSPAESHLRRLAEATGGSCDFVAPGEAVEPAVLRMFARLRSPHMSALRLEWPTDCVPQWVAPLPLSVFDGDTLHVYALLPKRPTQAVQLLAKTMRDTEDGDALEIARVTLSGDNDATDTLARMAASLRIETDPTPAEAQARAVAYQLVTQYTDFVLVHERAEQEKASDMPALHTVPHMLPAGWGGTGSVTTLRGHAQGVKKGVTGSQLLDLADCPAFLRRQSDDYPSTHASQTAHWVSDTHSLGLTPLGLKRWLRDQPPSTWPTTYAGLRAIGLDQELIDGLERSLVTFGGCAYFESEIVEAFLYVLTQIEWVDAPEQTGGFYNAFHSTLKRMCGMLTSTHTEPLPVTMPKNTDLLDIMWLLLGDTMTASTWPEEMLVVDEVEKHGSPA
jgi:Ca-activated chloride channel family protein